MITPCWGDRVGFWVTSCWGSWFNGYFPLGKLVSGLLPAGGEGGLHDYPCWGRGWGFGLLPAGEVGLMVTSHCGSWFQGYSPLRERVGYMITPCWGRGGFLVTSHSGSWFNGYFELGKLVPGLLPTGGEGGLHDFNTPHWRRGWVLYFLPAGEVGFQGYSPLEARVGFLITSHWGS